MAGHHESQVYYKEEDNGAEAAVDYARYSKVYQPYVSRRKTSCRITFFTFANSLAIAVLVAAVIYLYMDLLSRKDAMKSQRNLAGSSAITAEEQKRLLSGIRDDKPPDAQSSYSGIPQSDIAHLYGDVKEVEKFVKQPPDSEAPDKELYFTEHYRADQGCGDGLRNSRTSLGDVWCPRDKNFAIAPTAVKQHTFPYFRKAPWMANNSSFEVLPMTGKVRAKTNGLYLVQFNVNYNTKDDGGVRIIKETSMQSRQIVGSCYIMIALLKQDDPNADKNVLPCTASQVVSLKAGDAVYLDFHPFVFFELGKSNLHMTVIKLNDESLD